MFSDVDDVDEHARSFLRPDAHVLDEHVIETAELLPRLCKRAVQVLHEIVPDPRHGIADLLLEPCELKHEVAEPLHGRLEVPADLHLLSVCGELVKSLHQLRCQHNVLDGFAEGIRRCLHRPRGVLADHHLAGQLLHGEVLRCGGLHQAEDGGGHACDRRADHRRSADEIRRHVSRRCLHSAVKAVNRRLGLSKARLVQAHAKADQIFLDHLTDHCLTSLCSAAYTSARRRFSPSTSIISWTSSKSLNVYVPSHSSCCCHFPAMTGAYTHAFTLRYSQSSNSGDRLSIPSSRLRRKNPRC